MATIASLVVDLTARTSKFTSNISKARQPVEQLRLHIERTQRSIDSLTRTSRRMALWGGATFTALAKAGSKMVNLASEAEQLNNVINRTFGHMAAEVNQWAEDTGNALGRSTHSMRSYAGYMQALLRPMVGVTETAAEMSMSLAELAVDLAAFYDTEDQEAFDALRSALVGQTQPLKRYGVAMTQATLQAYAYEKGIKKSIQTMTEAEKVQLRYQYILDQTRLVQGTALAEADEYANVQKALSEEFREQAETIGHILKPAYQWVLEQGRELIRWFDRLEDSTKANIVQVGLIAGALVGFIATLGVAGMAVAAMVKGLLLLGTVFAFITSPLVIGLTLIALGVAGLKTAWDNNWGGIQDKTLEVVDAILVKWNELTAWWETSDFGQAVRDAWADIVAVWTSDELTLPQKAIETVSIVANTIADLIPSIRAIWDVWTDDDLSLAEKTLATVSIIAGSVSGLIESITTWWINTTVTLAEKVVTMLGLNPDENAFVGFLRQLQTIWNNEELTLGEKVIESLNLIPGVRALQTFYQKLSEIWTNDQLTFGAKVVDTIELLADTAIVKIVLATLAGVAVWKILPAVYSALSAAITLGAGKLAAGGLVLGKIAIASALLVLGAGAIGWVFGDKEGRDAWVEAIKESVRQINLDEPITVPIAIMDILRFTFDFGAEGLREARAKVAELREELSLWEPGVTEAPEWLPDLAKGALELGISLAKFIGEGFLLVFDIGQLIGNAIAKGTVAAVESIINFGKELGSALVDAIVDRLPDWLKGWLGIETTQPISEVPTVEISPVTSIPVEDVDWETVLNSLSDGPISSVPVEPVPVGVDDFVSYIERELSNIDLPIDWRFLAAQWGLETGWGKHLPAGFNMAGIKGVGTAGSETQLTREVIAGQELMEEAQFAAFNNIREFAEAYIRLLETSYPLALQAKTIDEFAAGLLSGVGGRRYATDPEYASLISGTFNSIVQRGFAQGGYTGNIPVDQFAGFVHGQEWVIPPSIWRRGAAAVLEFIGLPGFKDGRVTAKVPGLNAAKTTVGGMNNMFSQIGQTILSGLTTLFEIIASAIEALAIALVGEERVEEIKNVFGSMRTALEEFRKSLTEDSAIPDPQPNEVASRWYEALQAAFDNINWQQPMDTFVATLAAGLAEAESLFVQFAGEITRLIKVVVGKTEEGSFQITLDWDYMLQQMVNSLANMLAESFANLFAGYDIPGQRQDVFPNLTELLENVENYEKNRKRLEQLQRSQDLATVGGGLAGAGIGFAIGGPLGALIGGFLGALGGKKTSQAATQKEIEELARKLQDDFLAIKELLGTTMQDVANALSRAFSADTYEGFVTDFSRYLEDQVRNALVTAFMTSEAIRPLIEELSNQITYAVMDGMIDAEERDSILSLYDQIIGVSGDFYNSLQELGIATGDTANKMGELSEVLRNVPQGLKIVSHRLAAAGYSAPGVQAVARQETVGGGGDYAIHVHFDGDVYGMDDFDRRVRQAVAQGNRQVQLATYGV